MTAIVWTFVQARLGSTRLPRKVLTDIDGKTMLEHVMGRAHQIGYPVALLIPQVDKELAGLALAHDWVYLEGPEEDVLGRFADGVRAFRPDHVIRICADSPFISPEWARWTVNEHLRGGYDLTWDEAEGRGVQVFKAESLLRADREAGEAWRHSPDVWMIHSDLLHDGRFSAHRIRTSVDTEADLELARRRAAWAKQT